MLVLAVCVIALLSPLVAGRWPAGVVLGRWRWPWLIWAALATQIVIIEFGAPGALAPILHVATYVLALAFVWLNRSSLGLVVVGVGAFLNGITIALNGGTLPARAEAVEAAGIDVDHAFVNAGVVEDPVLPWLGDVFAWPAPMPLANTFSVGDILIVAGVAVAAWTGSVRVGSSPHHSGHEGADSAGTSATA